MRAIHLLFLLNADKFSLLLLTTLVGLSLLLQQGEVWLDPSAVDIIKCGFCFTYLVWGNILNYFFHLSAFLESLPHLLNHLLLLSDSLLMTRDLLINPWEAHSIRCHAITHLLLVEESLAGYFCLRLWEGKQWANWFLLAIFDTKSGLIS